ncbi:replication/maintenance protein RepL [Niallia circulans]|uniref:replication/maintenance protein RepL n=1 Tax=Niallia circulans TaxID=1397 RepID=UPI001F2848B6|nr:replication/maintenance protein RepL [Niallia circulans]MCF2649687.1 replication/maintenance protein RepL [Niallia circulans]
MEGRSEFPKVQAFLEDLLVLHGMSKGNARLLFEMIPYVNQDNQMIINAFLKKELAEKTGISKGTIDNALTKLTEVGLFTRLDRGAYQIHPVLLEVHKLLQEKTAHVVMTYTAKGRKIGKIEGEHRDN